MSKKKKSNFAPRVPLSVRGGIRVQSNRSGFARKWWSHQWLLLLEKFQIGARLGRGRVYAYAGQVSSLELEAGRIVAHVQGADKAAYDCEICCAVLTPREQEQVIRNLRKRPLLLAELLVRELPKAVDAIFAEAGLSLLPDKRTDVKTRCSCPDRVNPCKHLAAVFFLLIEAFEQDPLLLLALRGVSREALTGNEADTVGDSSTTTPVSECQVDETMAMAPATFWGTAGDDTPDFGPAPTGGTAAPLVQRLGPLPLWRGEERFMDVMTQVGGRAVALGWQAWAGERILRLRPKLIVTNPNLRLRGSRLKTEG